jgi:hypothetical protein
VRAVVAKVWDSHSPGDTKLHYPKLDVPSAQPMINSKAKAAVVRYELSDQSPTGDVFDIPYDLDGNGKLSFDVVAGGGAELNAIVNGLPATSDFRIVVVREMISLYYLAADAAIGDSVIRLRLKGINANNYFKDGYPATIGTGESAENVTVKAASKPSADVTLRSALTKPHAAGDPVTFPAGGWGGGNPIVILEAAYSEQNLKWVFFHETGHSALKLADLNAPPSIMHFGDGWTDHRLRYKHQNKQYDVGSENQWEHIPRT